MQGETLSGFRQWFSRALGGLTNALFPRQCLKCGVVISPGHDSGTSENGQTRGVRTDAGDFPDFYQTMAAHVCPDCAASFVPISPLICKRCGSALEKSASDARICRYCLEFPPRFRKARAYGAYEQILRQLIRDYKYRGKIGLARPFGMLLFSAFIRHWNPEEIDVILPIPLHIRRFRERGFNQAYLLLRDWPQLAKNFRVDRMPLIEKHAIVRRRATKPQVGLDRAAREENIRNAFHVRMPEKIRGKRILLVDDVITTGSTANECSKLLMDHGVAARVDMLALARAGGAGSDIRQE